jgi:[ribosomal protein S5]-alanine N-acetyltransferase
MISLDTTLRTRRCILRAVEHRDLEHVWTASRYPGFNDGMIWDAPASRQDMEDWTAKTLERWTGGESYTFTGRTTLSDDFVGRLMLRPLKAPGACRVGYWIHPTLWNLGYATEIARAGVYFAFEMLDVQNLTCAHALWNTASERVMRKVGFTFGRFIPQGFVKRGEWVAENEYRITRSDWLERTAPPSDKKT